MFKRTKEEMNELLQYYSPVTQTTKTIIGGGEEGNALKEENTFFSFDSNVTDIHDIFEDERHDAFQHQECFKKRVRDDEVSSLTEYIKNNFDPKRVDRLYHAFIKRHAKRGPEGEWWIFYGIIARINYQPPIYFDIEIECCKHDGIKCKKHPPNVIIFFSKNFSLFVNIIFPQRVYNIQDLKKFSERSGEKWDENDTNNNDDFIDLRKWYSQKIKYY